MSVFDSQVALMTICSQYCLYCQGRGSDRLREIMQKKETQILLIFYKSIKTAATCKLALVELSGLTPSFHGFFVTSPCRCLSLRPLSSWCSSASVSLHSQAFPLLRSKAALTASADCSPWGGLAPLPSPHPQTPRQVGQNQTKKANSRFPTQRANWTYPLQWEKDIMGR